MEKNYYEILEIDKKASSEMIKKAYSTLVKKNHPDLQPDNLKSEYEEKIKLINEAYEVLADKEKRKNYDITLQNLENKNQEIIDDLINENNVLKNKLNELDNLYRNIYNKSKNEYNNINNENSYTSNNTYDNNLKYDNNYINYNNNINDNTSTQEDIYNNNYADPRLYQQELERARQKAYHDAYIQDLQSRGYRIKYKKTLKEHLISFVSIIITISILFFIWQLPFVRKFFSEIEGLNIIAKFFDKLF